jgi:hypothetical protein
MKHLLLTTIAAVLVVGCGESQQSTPVPETQPVKPVAEAAKSEPPTAKAPDISIHDAAEKGNIEAVKQHIAAGTDVNTKGWDDWTPLHFALQLDHKEIAGLLIAKGADVNAKENLWGWTPLHYAARSGEKEIIELLIAEGADVNVKDYDGETPLDSTRLKETAILLRKHGGESRFEELKAAGK